MLLTANPAAAQPEPPSFLRVGSVGEFSVNITWGASPSPDVAEYRVYVSETNGTTLGELRPLLQLPSPYDFVFVTPPENLTGMAPAAFPPWAWFRNATTPDWTLARQTGFDKHVPSDATEIAYEVTGLPAEQTVYLAVTAVDGGGVENPSVSPVEAMALSQPIPERPRNEGIYASWGLILIVVLSAVFYVSRREARRSRKAYLYILPPLLGLVALTFYPVIFGFFLSFTDRMGTQDPSFDLIGLLNYGRVFAQPDFVMVSVTTIVWTVVNVFFHVTIGLFLAVLLNRKLRGRVVYRAALLLPWAVPSYITTLAWRGMFETLPEQGLINGVLARFGLLEPLCGGPCAWLTATGSPLPLLAVIVTNVWLGFPFMMMVFSGGLQGIAPELYEAADVDGLTAWQKFRHITFPLLKPTIVPASLLGFIWTFNMFNVIYLMTAGGPPVPGMRAGATDILITYVYNVGFLPPFEHGFAAAYSVVIFFMLLGFGLFYTKYTGALEAFAGGTAPPVRRRLRYPGAALVARAREAWRVHIADPIRAAMGPDQPERPRVAPWLIAAIAALGLFEAWYGASVYGSMRSWFIVDAVAGAWFFVSGAGILLGAVGLAFLQRAGRRVASWFLLIAALGGALSFLGAPGPLPLRFLAHAVALRLLARSWPEYVGDDDPWTRLTDALSGLRPARHNPRPPFATRRWTNVLAHAFLLPFTFLTIVPVLVVLGTAFGTFPAMALANTPFLRDVFLSGQTLPGWTLEHFEFILFESRFPLWLRNSILVSAGTTAVGVLLATTGAYGFSRFHFFGKRWSMLSFIVVQMFPGVIILIPYYVLLFQLGLINTHIGLVMMYSVTALPFVVWFLKGFFDTIPVDLEEAAMVDGTTRAGALWRIIVPIAKPAIAVAALFSFLAAWNEWLLAFTFMTSSDNYTLPVGVSSFINPPQVFWNEFAAISVLVSIPVVALFIIFQKYLVSGLTSGAVKG